MSEDESQKSPVRDARDDALAAKLRYDQGRHGLAQAERQTLLRQWQTYLWAYYSQIAGYKQTRNIENEWFEPIAPEQGHPDSLADLEEYQFATEKITDRRKDSFSGVTRVNEREQPAVWPADALRAIQGKLDECYHALGFDEPPRRVVKHTGTIGEEYPEWFAEDYTVEIWREFTEEVGLDGDLPAELDGAIELAVGNVSEEKGEEQGPEDNNNEP